jgi:hypothetical protein
MITPVNSIAAILTLIPLFAVAFFPRMVATRAQSIPVWARLVCPGILSVPYVLVTAAAGAFQLSWFALYALLPIALAGLLWQAASKDPEQHGNWRDFLVLAALGLAVDLRWFESAWPAHLAIVNKMLLLDAGIYGFILVRQLDGIGFDLRLRWRDAVIGLREVAWYTPIALALGLSLGFLHLHLLWLRSLKPGSLPSSSSPFRRSFFFGDGSRIFWNAASDAHRRCCLRLSSLGCRTSTSAQPISTGGTYCWPRWPASSMAAPGAKTGELAHRPLLTPRWTQSGLYG